MERVLEQACKARYSRNPSINYKMALAAEMQDGKGFEYAQLMQV
jgi:hypothetical protein